MEPVPERRSTEKQAHTTPTKAKFQKAIGFLEADGQAGRMWNAFKFWGVEEHSSYEIINNKTTNRRLKGHTSMILADTLADLPSSVLEASYKPVQKRSYNHGAFMNYVLCLGLAY